ncbi:MAG: hypothetical protein HS107_14795 [Thermoflexaceae bacterium]|nr:hypothetical protein [Thermoflexaceae bacterium]
MDTQPPEARRDHRRLLENLRRAAEAESAEARAAQWRDATPERHARVLADVIDLADAIQRSREQPFVKPPLDYPHLRGKPSRLCS